MTLFPNKGSPKPTLDDLLRLKRREHPGAAFWDGFDRRLREKQLAALMQQPRGWARTKPLFLRTLRWSIPLAAATIVVLQIPLAKIPVATGNSDRGSGATAVVVPAVQPTPALPVAAIAVSSEDAMVHRSEFVSTEVATAPRATSTPSDRSERRKGLSDQSGLLDPIALSSWRTNAGQGFAAGLSPTGADDQVSPWADEFSENGPMGSWRGASSRLLQLTALDLRVTASYAENLPSSLSSRPLPSRRRWSNASEDRDFREAVSRVGVTGSKLSIRF